MATAPLIGNFGEFDPEKEDFENYAKRLNVWFTVNKIKSDDKVSVFLALVGAKAFGNLISMSVPDDPSTKTLAVLTEMLENFYKSQRNEITERMKFRESKQKENETVSEFIVDLKRLSIRCGYDETLSENLRDTFTAGLRDFNTRKKLLSIKI